jgi:hypothetical protein
MVGKKRQQLKDHLVCHGWNDLPDYSSFRTKEELKALYRTTYPGESEKQLALWLPYRELKNIGKRVEGRSISRNAPPRLEIPVLRMPNRYQLPTVADPC